jgi:hypothetical protein
MSDELPVSGQNDTPRRAHRNERQPSESAKSHDSELFRAAIRPASVQQIPIVR